MKQHYVVPQISVFGSVETLTQGGSGGDTDEFVFNNNGKKKLRTDTGTRCGFTNNNGRDILCS